MPDAPQFCASCGTALAPLALMCPSCRQLVYASTLEDLARKAQSAESSGDLSGAAALWRQALALLPPDSAQAAAIRQRLVNPQSGPGAPRASQKSDWAGRLGPLGALA